MAVVDAVLDAKIEEGGEIEAVSDVERQLKRFSSKFGSKNHRFRDHFDRF